MKPTKRDYLINGIISFVLIMISIVMLLPFINIIATSFTSPIDTINSNFILWPKHPTLNVFKYIFQTDTTTHALKVSIFITVTGTLLSMILSVITAYSLAYRNLKGRRIILLLVTFTMLFSPGMIANFVTFRLYGMQDSFLALIFPRAINVFYLLLMKNFFQDIPEEIKESATIDGCSVATTLFWIVLPLSLPALATFTLFYAVDNWNAFFDALLYISDSKKWPVTIIMRQIVLMVSGASGSDAVLGTEASPVSIRMGIVTVTMLPILITYPLLQKYFVSGLMVGSVKG